MEEIVEKTDTLNPADINFYIVSPEKFLVLFLVTFGLYSVYWFYKNWSLYKQSTNGKIWPIMRGIFSIFFIHSLFSHIEAKHNLKTNSETEELNSLATIFIIFSIIGNVGDRIAAKGIGLPFTILSGIITLPIVCWAVYKAQLLINASSNDKNGDTNSNYSLINSFWLICGALLWLLVLLGIFTVFIEA